MSNILKIAASGVEAAPTEYQISRSLRFNSADSAYLSRTPASAGNRKTWTWSGWVKLGFINNWGGLFYAGDGNADPATFLYFYSDGTLEYITYNGSTQGRLITSQLFRDPSAWYHIVLVVDTTNATADNRQRIYLNGVEITTFSTRTNHSLNADTYVNDTASSHAIGRTFQIGTTTAKHFNGYLTEVHFVDGQALTPSDFGETDATTGVWKPKAYAGTYGTNGFYLDFSDNSSTTALGYDAAGSNNWTPNNFSVTAGVGNDSLVDTPTPYGTDTGAGGEVRGNYCTLNPLSTIGETLSNGNLYQVGSLDLARGSRGTIAVSSGKWYYEFNATVTTNTWGVGWIGVTSSYNGGGVSGIGVMFYDNGNKQINGSNSAYGSSWSTEVIGCALDLDSLEATFYINGVSQGTITGITADTYYPGGVTNAPGDAGFFNFGQRPFAYTAPSGFKALCTQNLPTPTVVQGDDYFNTVLYTGNGSTQSITGVGFQPDWVWIKERSGAADHGLYDAVRGVQNQLESNTTTAETTESTGLTAFGSDGFTVSSLAQLNTNTDTYVAWNWNAGGSNATNTDGTITSTVRANTTAGFSVGTFTAPASGAFTVGHGLGVAPKMYIMKSRSNAYSWGTYHVGVGNTGRLDLNSTNAVTTTSGSAWNNTSPTSTVFSAGADWAGSGITYVFYAFAEIEGYSKFGSYTGNGSADGVFVYCGFRPAFILWKSSTLTTGWVIWDTTRNTYNVVGAYVFPNLSNAEATATAVDILSNGFKLRTNSSGNNSSGETVIFAAFAENPFKYSLAR